MSSTDWIVLIVTLAGIIMYGLYKSRSEKNLESYFLQNRSSRWYMILLGIMGTQASAVTFLSAPGQAYTDGMRFVQYYFGLPLAMVVLCVTFVPVFHKLKLFTAYEFLEKRFDGKTRTFTSLLFLLQRGLSTGISISAPSIILSSLLGWDILWTNILMGGLLIIYTVTGGAKAVAYTQQIQFVIIFAGMLMAGYMVVHLLPARIGLSDALHIGGKAGKLNVITSGVDEKGFNWNDRYNMWSGVIGGFFLALSYFGTDQSQVGRYLTAKSVRDSRLGLLMNGLVKVPMQFGILLIGTLVFSYYQFAKEPLFFNQTQIELLSKTKYADSLKIVLKEHDHLQQRKVAQMNPSGGMRLENRMQEGLVMQQAQADQLRLRTTIKRWLNDKEVKGNSNDTNYIFLRFVIDHLPQGLIGLLIAVIFLSAWGSVAASLNALSSATINDIHKRMIKKPLEAEKEYQYSQWYTLAWGIFCVVIAQLAYNIGNSLIEAVNVLGSLFYGVILGIFLVAFYIKKITATPVFISALITETFVITIHVLNQKEIINISFLWLNAIGAIGMIVLSAIFQKFKRMADDR
ncbi:MAG: sodium:solute symporter [Bacteroidota bacterium]|nr:sodium:solute symporter [Bacteroidota bacterium]MDP4212855.1 sodium:solute symporter [Bacteroidota bacterium]MDP4250355.1 sodium:solute symporter [Bacteroidota bacterium]